MDTILIVDDEEEILGLLKVYLENENYRVVTFGEGQKALEYLQTGTADLAILDIMLPDMDGYRCRHGKRIDNGGR